MGEIIRRNAILRERYDELRAGDLVLGQLNIKPCEEYIFLDLLSRGVEVVPSPLSQQLSRSKCMQATVFARFMLPLTSVIRCRKDLVLAAQQYAARGIGRVISKQDRGDCGTGINLWHSMEDLYNAVSLNNDFFPFVVQPFLDEATDIRVIILDDYQESYWRKNSKSFRNNIHFGGESGACSLDDRQAVLCKTIMKRGGFPFAHIDLLVAPDNRTWFSEISLKGGLKGAGITPGEYRERLSAFYDRIVRRHSCK